jgi:hypothetical protein
MALKITVPCSGEEHVILVKATDEFSDDFEVELASHSREYDQAFEAMGGDRPSCYIYERSLDFGIDGVLRDDRLRKVFLKALGEQGVDTLGIDEGELAEQITSTIGSLFGGGSSLVTELAYILSELHGLLPWYEQTSEFKKAADEFARLAYENDDVSVFDILWEMRGGGLLSVKEIDEEGDCGEGHTINRATIKIMIDDACVDSWTFGYAGWFSDFEHMKWTVEREDGSGDSNSTTEEFLRVAGIEGSDAIEFNYKPEPPEFPKRLKSGKWAVISEGGYYRYREDLCGLFKTEDDARAMYAIVLDVHRMSGDRGTAKLLRRIKGSKADDFDTWEVVEEV